jgi:hypothetical protein
VFASGHHRDRQHGGVNVGVKAKIRIGGTMQAKGQVTDIMPNAFILTLSNQDIIGLNVTHFTRFRGFATATASANPLADGQNVTVDYRVTGSGDMALLVTLAGSVNGKPRNLRGMITNVSAQTLQMDLGGGATASLTLTPQTQYIPVGVPTTQAGQPPVPNDFAMVRAQEVNGVLDALVVRFGPRPWGIPASRARGTVEAVGNASLTLQLAPGVNLPVNILNQAVILLDGNAVQLGQIQDNMEVEVRGWRFDGAFYADWISAKSTTTTPPPTSGQTINVPLGFTPPAGGTLENMTAVFSVNNTAELNLPLPLTDLSNSTISFAAPSTLSAGVTYSVAVVLQYAVSGTVETFTTPSVSYTAG